ncbi:MAG: PEP-CTERM sorting domain-containing protein [Aquabacterium sp.]
MNKTCAGLALAALICTTSAQAFVYAPDSTPEQDLYDGQTHLQWIKADTLAAGQRAGYRLATSAEAEDLIQKTLVDGVHYWGSPSVVLGEHPGSPFFLMGANFAPDPSTFTAWDDHEMVSIGYVDGGRGDNTTLAGMLSYYWMTGAPRSGWTTTRFGQYLIGTQADFEANKVAGTSWIPVKWWTEVMTPDWYQDGKLDVGYFMVKENLTLSPIPEPSSALLMGFGLAIIGVVRRPTRLQRS